MNFSTALALALMAALIYYAMHQVPHDTCADIWLHANPLLEEQRMKRHSEDRTDPEQAEFVAQCARAAISNHFDNAYWTAKAGGRFVDREAD
jgi:hypothetical protein